MQQCIMYCEATHGQGIAPEIASVCVEYGFPANTSSHTSFTCLKSDQDDPRKVPLQTPWRSSQKLMVIWKEASIPRIKKRKAGDCMGAGLEGRGLVGSLCGLEDGVSIKEHIVPLPLIRGIQLP